MKPLNYSHDPFAALERWEFAPPFQEKTQIEGVTLFLSGMQARHPKWGEVVGSSANLGSFPESHAWYELIERIAIVQAMEKTDFVKKNPLSEKLQDKLDRAQVFPESRNDQYQFSKSNGVALFSSWTEACRRACFELVERHLVLASWLGHTKPEVLGYVGPNSLDRLKNVYDVWSISFGRQKVTAFPATIHVSGVLLRPKAKNLPLIVAFGAGPTQEESLHKAQSETWQRLGFLWGEPLPEHEPSFLPSQLYHQDYYLYPKHHAALDEWLTGKWYQPGRWVSPDILKVEFVDFSSPQALHFRVAKAISPDAIPLVFGRWDEGPFAGLDPKRRVHPIA